MNDYTERLKNEEMNELSAWIKVNKWRKRVNENEWMIEWMKWMIISNGRKVKNERRNE